MTTTTQAPATTAPPPKDWLLIYRQHNCVMSDRQVRDEPDAEPGLPGRHCKTLPQLAVYCVYAWGVGVQCWQGGAGLYSDDGRFVSFQVFEINAQNPKADCYSTIKASLDK